MDIVIDWFSRWYQGINLHRKESLKTLIHQTMAATQTGSPS
jgi:hypothetical protein